MTWTWPGVTVLIDWHAPPDSAMDVAGRIHLGVRAAYRLGDRTARVEEAVLRLRAPMLPARRAPLRWKRRRLNFYPAGSWPRWR